MHLGGALQTNTATPALMRLGRSLDSTRQAGLMLAWGIKVRDHARANARAKGGKSLWKQIAASVQVRRLAGSGVELHTDHVAARMRHEGGTIRPKGSANGGADALTIPISPASRGKRAGEFAAAGRNLFVLKRPGKAPLLGYSARGRGAVRNSAGQFQSGEVDRFVPLYVLMMSVRHPAAPWWPSDATALQIGEDLAIQHLKSNGV